MSKEDLGEFGYKAGLKIKVFPKTQAYYDNYDRIFKTKDYYKEEIIKRNCESCFLSDKDFCENCIFEKDGTVWKK